MFEEYNKEYNDIIQEYNKIRITFQNKIRNLYIKASEDIGNVFLENSFVKFSDENIYYDKKTNVGVKIEIPDDIDIDSPNSILPLTIVYKCKEFLSFETQIYFYYQRETPKKVFDRFRKRYNSRSGVKDIKEYMSENYSHEMLIQERKNKLNNLNK